MRRPDLLEVVFFTAAFRLALLQALLFSLFAAVMLWGVWSGVNQFAEQQLRRDVRIEMASLRQARRDGTLTRQLQGRLSVAAGGPTYYLLADRQGRRIAGNLAYRPTEPGWHAVGLTRALGPNNPDADRVDLLAERLADGRWLVVGSDNRDIIELGEILSGRLVDIGGVVIVLVLISGALGSRRLLRRIDAMGEQAEQSLDRGKRTIIEGGRRRDEFDRLALRLNRILDRTHTLMQGLRQVSSDIAHDLRTPLIRVRQNLEAFLQRSGHDVAHGALVEEALLDLDRLLGTFRAMLRIASIEARERREGFAEFNLSMLIETIADTYAVVAEDRGQVIATDGAADQSFYGDRDLLAQLLSNLIENALHHTPPHTKIVVGWRACAAGMRLWVADSGPGIPASERVRVLQRFVRLESSRSTPGNGLGLSLVAAIAALHQLSLSLEDAQPGLRVVLQDAGCAAGRPDGEQLRADGRPASGLSPWSARPRP